LMVTTVGGIKMLRILLDSQRWLLDATIALHA